jgi:hypothetical protein
MALNMVAPSLTSKALPGMQLLRRVRVEEIIARLNGRAEPYESQQSRPPCNGVTYNPFHRRSPMRRSLEDDLRD